MTKKTFTMKQTSILIFLFLLISCTPKIDYVTYNDTFKKWNQRKEINEVDSSASMVIYFNTYTGMFEGRESFLSYKKNHYSIDFLKCDTFYTKKDIKRFSISGYNLKDTSFIPELCDVRVKHVSTKRIIVEFEINDKAICDKLKGKFKLKLDTEYPQFYDIWKYYKY
jgi:hypothetical protein